VISRRFQPLSASSQAVYLDKCFETIIAFKLIGNETPVSDARNRFLQQLIQDAHSADSTRLVSAALQAHEIVERNRITIHIDDPIASDLDVLGNNEYIGWYVRRPSDADSIDWVSEYGKPLIMSEFGGDALFGYHGDALTRWTEEYQENLYEHQIVMLKRIPFLRGMTPWILKDFRSPRRTLPHIEDYFNRKGLVSAHGEKKKAFFVLQTCGLSSGNSFSGRLSPLKGISQPEL
jgi:beta-glucuronidase